MIPGGLLGLPPRLLAGMLWSLLTGRRRSLAADAACAVASMVSPPVVEGCELVPEADPFLLVANHYQVPGVWVGWSAAAITHAVAAARARDRGELHWVAFSEWRWFELAGRWMPAPLTPQLFPRGCHVWSLIPMPPRPTDVAGRARALREVLAYLGVRARPAGARPEPVALFPEGRATVALAEAKPGVGALIHRVSARGVPLLPVGVCREGRGLAVRIGQPFSLGASQLRGDELDRWASRRVMAAIGRLLPSALWGEYAGAIAEPEG